MLWKGRREWKIGYGEGEKVDKEVRKGMGLLKLE